MAVLDRIRIFFLVLAKYQTYTYLTLSFKSGTSSATENRLIIINIYILYRQMTCIRVNYFEVLSQKQIIIMYKPRHERKC